MVPSEALSDATDENGVLVRMQQGLNSAVLSELVARGFAPRAVIPQKKTLKQFFLELTRRQPQRAEIH